MGVYADFNNRDPDGLIRLNTVGTTMGLAAMGVALREGLRLIVSDGDLEADVVVRACGPENIWRAEIVGDVREVGANHAEKGE